MSVDVDPGILTLFGGETKVLTLAALSSASQPLTGYRVTKLTKAQPTKVYAEIRRLANAGFLTERPTLGGRRGWIVSDPDLRSLFRRRVRLLWNEDLSKTLDEAPKLKGSDSDRVLKLDVTRYRPNRGSIPNPKEFVRPLSKDAALAAAGLRTTRRGNRKL
jgi:hypothetical protein